ncbi:uncharacterized protein [Macrobrachium rosenbergii]|uniref:uncharacterized protein n=1 Tax=Macrobrachium rosenbergii TaxID=79674 RepID=UPI0034D42A08
MIKNSPFLEVTGEMLGEFGSCHPDMRVVTSFHRASVGVTFLFIIFLRPFSEYHKKQNQILADHSKFQKINKNPIKDIRRDISRTVERIHAARNAPRLPLAQGDFNPRYIYGTVKTHKPGNPLSPIISQIPTQTYNIAKRINDLLTPYIPDRYCLQSSTDCLRKLQGSPSTGIIASLEVQSLFTNVPVDETIEHILNRVYRCEDTPTMNIHKEALKALLGTCTKKAPFTTHRAYPYCQINVVTTESTLGILFANFYMRVIEERVFSKIPCPSQNYRYIDDTFVRVNNEDLEKLRTTFGECSVLRFTCKHSVEDALPLLDVQAQQSLTGYTITVYKKPTNPGLCFNGSSECPDRYKSLWLKPSSVAPSHTLPRGKELRKR